MYRIHRPSNSNANNIIFLHVHRHDLDKDPSNSNAQFTAAFVLPAVDQGWLQWSSCASVGSDPNCDNLEQQPSKCQSGVFKKEPCRIMTSFYPVASQRCFDRPTDANVAGRRTVIRLNMISSGFSFQDGQQILVSVQKPLGIVLEQGAADEEDSKNNSNVIVLAQIDAESSAARAGLQVGDILVAVQNASTESVDLDEVLDFIAKAPRVINLRFVRPPNDS